MPFDQQSLRAVFEQIDQGFCVAELIVDGDGTATNYRFLEVNAVFSEMTGLLDPVGKTALELVPDLEAHWIKTYARVGLGRETLRFSEGSEAMGRWFDVFAVPVEPHGRFVLVFKDDTQRHVDDLALRGALEAERQTRERVELLQLTASRFSTVRSRSELAEALLQSLRRSLQIEIAAVNFLVDGKLEIIATEAADQDAVHKFQGIGLDEHLPGTAAIRQNRSLVVTGRNNITAEYPGVDIDKYLIETITSVPLNDSHGAPIGALVVGSSQHDWASGPNLDLLVAITRQAGLVAERVVLHERLIEAARREHEIALKLQESLLPYSLVANLSLTLAAHYSAAADLMSVGGDWYDSFEWSGRYVGLVVGDVAGHDLAATTSMGRLRSGVSALAPLIEPCSDSVLDAYGHCARINSVDFATAACVVIDTVAASLVYSLAGHLPPLLLLPNGEAQWLNEALVTPLGLEVRSHTTHRCPIPPGSSVILYSDGLVERRSESIDDGLARLKRSALRHRSTQLPEFMNLVTEDMLGPNGPTDDIILLCARYQPVNSTTAAFER